MTSKSFAKVGKAALWIYTNHLLVFAIGGFLVGLETLAICAPLMATPNPSFIAGVVLGLALGSILFCGAKVVDFIRGLL